MRHHRRTNQKAVGEVRQLANLRVGVNPGLADNRHIVPQTRRQLAGTVEVDGEVTQIAVINADDFGLQCNGAFQLFLVAHFGQHAHIQTVRHGGKLAILLVVQHREHQQAGIRLMEARQVDLVSVDDKVFAQNRLRRDLADDWQEIEAALEILLVS